VHNSTSCVCLAAFALAQTAAGELKISENNSEKSSENFRKTQPTVPWLVRLAARRTEISMDAHENSGYCLLPLPLYILNRFNDPAVLPSLQPPLIKMPVN
jgi:hypothetical protein